MNFSDGNLLAKWKREVAPAARSCLTNSAACSGSPAKKMYSGWLNLRNWMRVAKSRSSGSTSYSSGGLFR